MGGYATTVEREKLSLVTV